MLLGCYLILKQDMTPDQVADRFSTILREQLEDFRDATHLPADFGLTLRDCWGGVYRGKECGWIARPAHADSPLWGAIDIEEYSHYDDPSNADLHQVVPGKLVAFRGPRDLGRGALIASSPRLEGVPSEKKAKDSLAFQRIVRWSSVPGQDYNPHELHDVAPGWLPTQMMHASTPAGE